ncbi:hypothetical protein [Psychromicrobium xiongbiense]|uniref:hypothetical protein n=1 Tax=Psychromicrobium xiongbiense TaxID=3051184 RepID=UPI00255655BF|nr:hypothetical protein [Psychromicrobium sp. YIM S02556]
MTNSTTLRAIDSRHHRPARAFMTRGALVTALTALTLMGAGTGVAQAAPAAGCTPTTTIAAPNATTPYDGRIEVPAAWAQQVQGASGVLPATVPSGHSVTGTRQITEQLYSASSGTFQSINVSVTIPALTDTPTGLHWTVENGRTFLDFSATTDAGKPSVSQQESDLQNTAINQAIAAYPGFAANGSSAYQGQNTNTYTIPISYNNGCATDTVTVQVTGQTQLSGGGGL